MKKLFILLFATVLGLQLSAQEVNTRATPKPAPMTMSSKDIVNIVIQTNGTCAQCGAHFSSLFKNVPAVKYCHYNVKTAQLTLQYDSTAVKPEMLRKGITELGYDADNMKANPEARAKLPECCRTRNASTQCTGEHHNGQHHGNCQRTQAQPAAKTPTTKK